MNLLFEADAPGRPVGGVDGADQVVAGNRAPATRIARARPVVAQHEVLDLRNALLRNRLLVAPVGRHIGLVQPRPVDVDVAALLAPTLAGKGDDALDVDDVRIANEAAGGCGSVRSVERGDVAAAWIAEPLRET